MAHYRSEEVFGGQWTANQQENIDHHWRNYHNTNIGNNSTVPVYSDFSERFPFNRDRFDIQRPTHPPFPDGHLHGNNYPHPFDDPRHSVFSRLDQNRVQDRLGPESHAINRPPPHLPPYPPNDLERLPFRNHPGGWVNDMSHPLAPPVPPLLPREGFHPHEDYEIPARHHPEHQNKFSYKGNNEWAGPHNHDTPQTNLIIPPHGELMFPPPDHHGNHFPYNHPGEGPPPSPLLNELSSHFRSLIGEQIVQAKSPPRHWKDARGVSPPRPHRGRPSPPRWQSRRRSPRRRSPPRPPRSSFRNRSPQRNRDSRRKSPSRNHVSRVSNDKRNDSSRPRRKRSPSTPPPTRSLATPTFQRIDTSSIDLPSTQSQAINNILPPDISHAAISVANEPMSSHYTCSSDNFREINERDVFNNEQQLEYADLDNGPVEHSLSVIEDGLFKEQDRGRNELLIKTSECFPIVGTEHMSHTSHDRSHDIPNQSHDIPNQSHDFPPLPFSNECGVYHYQNDSELHSDSSSTALQIDCPDTTIQKQDYNTTMDRETSKSCNETVAPSKPLQPEERSIELKPNNDDDQNVASEKNASKEKSPSHPPREPPPYPLCEEPPKGQEVTKRQKEDVPIRDNLGPESPESGEIISDKEEGEIEEISDVEIEKVTTNPAAPQTSLLTIEQHIPGIEFYKRRYPPYERTFDYAHRMGGVSKRRSSSRHHSSRYESSSSRRKRRKSSPPLRKDEEKELLLLRNAALETMIVKPSRQTTSRSPSKEPKQHIVSECSQDVIMAVDMDIVTSDSSRDHTPDITETRLDNKPIVQGKPPPVTVVQPVQSSVKVVTNRNATWKIPSFKIVTVDTEDEDESTPCDIGHVIEMYRQVAEAKISERSLSSLITELKQFEEELDEEEMKLQLLHQQLKVSEEKITSLKDNRSKLKKKIDTVQTALKPTASVPTITINPPPTTNSNVSSPRNTIAVQDSKLQSDSDRDDHSSTSRTASTSPMPATLEEEQNVLQSFEDVSQPSSISHSPATSVIDLTSDCDSKSDSGDTKQANTQKPSKEKVTVSTNESKPTNPAPLVVPGGGPSKKQLLTLVAARQNNNLAQVKGLLAVLEHNARKRKKSPNTAQSVGKKINQIKAAQNSRHRKLQESESTSSKSTRAILSSSDVKQGHSQAVADRKSTVLGNVLHKLQLETIEEKQIQDWFDNMTSNDITCDVTTPLVLSANDMVMSHVDTDNTTTVQSVDATSDPITSYLDEFLSNNKPKDKMAASSSTSLSSGDYESPLLKFRSYRLSPLYRTVFKRPLTSLTHSNRIRHDVIMCHHESQGTCNNKSCKAQHWSDVTMTHDDIITDFTRYLPSEKASSIHDTLSNKLSKLEKDQLQTMAAHIVHKELSHDDHVTISNQWLQATPKTPTDASTKQHNVMELSPDIFEDPTDTDLLQSNSHSSDSIDRFRYFNTASKVVNKATPKDVILNARKSSDKKQALEIVEKGLKEFPNDEALWIEYLRRLQRGKKLQGQDLERAVSFNASYSVYYEVIRLSVHKEKWILNALEHFTAIEVHENTSHIVLELLLCYCNWSLNVSGLDKALDVLNFTGPISEEGVMSRLSTGDKVLLGLVHIHLLHSRTLPTCVIGYHGNAIPLRIMSKKNFLVPFKQHKLNSQLFDDTMALFQCYIKRITIPSGEVSVNVTSCLPLYLNLFYFEVSQGNSRTTVISVSRLLNVVPDMRELLALNSILKPAVSITTGTDPLIYYLHARVRLSEGRDVEKVVSLLNDCVQQYFIIPEEDSSSVSSVILYRKLLGYQVPYGLSLPSLNDTVTPPDHSSLYLNYCLLVELTNPLLTDEVYEYALNHDVRVWLQYLRLLSHRVKSSPSLQRVKQLIDVSQRFSLAMKSSISYDYRLLEQDTHYINHDPLNKMLHILLGSALMSDNKLKLLKCLPLYDDPHWINSFYQLSKGSNFEEVQTVLASYLFKFPHHVEMWLIAINLEMRRQNFRQVRWLFSKAVQGTPYSKGLWNQFLLFELAGIVKHYSNLSLVQAVINQFNACGIKL